MAITIIAPEEYNVKEEEVSCFLAGGISNCAEWQKDVIEELDKLDTSSLVLYNPRRDNFDISNPFNSEVQIKWEFEKLNDMDIFSMYFDNSDSVQPICFYELGRHLERMKNRFPHSWEDRIVISVKEGFKRTQDVVIQSELAIGEGKVKIVGGPDEHAKGIYDCYCKVRDSGLGKKMIDDLDKCADNIRNDVDVDKYNEIMKMIYEKCGRDFEEWKIEPRRYD